MSKRIDFIGIGAMKCGTTWVSRCLEEHPEVLFSSQKSLKELHYFASNSSPTKIIHGASNYHRGMRWYLNQFPPEQSNKIIGEYCNSYFTDIFAPNRISKNFPNVKLILSLRDPSEMVYSLYWWLSASIKNPLNGQNFIEAFRNHKWLREKGLYSQYLKTYFKLFGREQVHIILFDDIKKDPKKVTTELFKFLNLSNISFTPSNLKKPVRSSIAQRSSFVGNSANFVAKALKGINEGLYWNIATNKNVYKIYKCINNKNVKYPKISKSDKACIKKYYEADVKKLEKLINSNLSAWYK